MSFESFFDGLIVGVTVATILSAISDFIDKIEQHDEKIEKLAAIFSATSDFIDKIEQHDDEIEKLSSRIEKHESSQDS